MTSTVTGGQAIEQMAAKQVHRVEVHPRTGQPDPAAEAVLGEARAALGSVEAVHCCRVYLIEAPLDDESLQAIAQRLLADPVSQQSVIGASAAPEGGALVEVHYQPGVMDPIAHSTREAIVEMLPQLARDQVAVRTGFRYDFAGPVVTADALRSFAEKVLANPVIQDIHLEPFCPPQFPQAREYELRLTHVPLCDLDDEGLRRLSRDGHLFLSLEEMHAVRDYFRGVGRDPTDVELETIAQTWSEHCVHKTLKSKIHYSHNADALPAPSDWTDRPGHTLAEDGSIHIDNLLKSTIAAATRRLMEDQPHRDWCVSVFEDNAGIVKFDDEHAVCIKVETHNHPSAIEPYGGAATGIGGCIRDVLGTGLGGQPIANTDVFCVGRPETVDLPKGVIGPRRILQQVVAGIRDYGNRKGIPTVNGAVWFHDDYLGNPLVFAGCIGMMPLDKCFGAAKPGDRIIVLGGATGRDGIHGATFSSAELTDTHADEFAHAVQIGNPITQKKMLDVILQARDAIEGCLHHAITDCGAGGFSSAVGEMGRNVGACVALERAPLKYAGLSYTEIWISEAQERMVLAVPPSNVERLHAMCEAEDVDFCDLGQFGWHAHGPDSGEPMLSLSYEGTEVGRLSMALLHDGIPTPTREAQWPVGESRAKMTTATKPPASSVSDALRALLSHPNIASKHWIVRQYDHEVQGGSAVKPLVGPHQDGPGDAAVIRPKLDSDRGIAIGCGMAPNLSEVAAGGRGDSYWMALAAIDEAVRNVVCVGADPTRIAILDNSCWPSCDDPRQLGSLVRAAEGCYDGALAYHTPFVSGKDSLNNQFTTDSGRVIAIPPTLLITALGIVPEVRRCCTADGKAARGALIIAGPTTSAMGGSHYRMVYQDTSCDDRIPHVDLTSGPRTAAVVAQLIADGLVAAAHDCSDGGMLVAAAEMAFAGRVGLDLDLENLPTREALSPIAACFAETPSRYLLQVEMTKLDAVVRQLQHAKLRFGQIGTFTDTDRLRLRCPKRGELLDESLDTLRQTWLAPLDW